MTHPPTDRPILFSASMVRAQLEDRKTQTRRLLTRLKRFGEITEFGPSDTPGYDWHFRDKEKRWNDLKHADLLKFLPWRVGMVLWVRENFQVQQVSRYWDATGERLIVCIDYPAAEGMAFEHNRKFFDILATEAPDVMKERKNGADGNAVMSPAIHLPRLASRLTLTITDVRAQRLLDINEEDAIAEGIFQLERKSWLDPNKPLYGVRESSGHDTAIGAYNHLWREINGDGSWAANPWVIALTFTVEKRNIDQVPT